MYLLVVATPLVFSFFILIFSSSLGNNGISMLCTLSVILTRLFTIYCLFDCGLQQSVIDLSSWNWISDPHLNLNWELVFDSFNILILVMITGVSSLIHLYSLEYMSSDPHQGSFMLYLTAFTFSMLLLVTSENLVQLFFGWEAIGICSFLLIGFWFTWIEANNSAINAVVINSVGDFFLTLSFFLIYFGFNTLNIYSIVSIVPEFQSFIFIPLGVNLIDVITLTIIFGISANSAQFPLHSWLVNAMSAPSPVSALIHAATLVTSGVFLIINFSSLFEYSFLLEWLSVLGISTALFAAVTGLVQNDLNSIIAYSTCSQLGYMVFSCGLSSYHISYFHLLNHGCFNALLFLGAGSLIHTISNKQDISFLGGLYLQLPLSYTFFIVGSLALIGFPFLSGFYSNDVIIEMALINFHWSGSYSYFMALFTAFITALYSSSLLFLVFLNSQVLPNNTFINLNESGCGINLALFILSLFSLLNGFLASEIFIGAGSDYFSNLVFSSSNHYNSISSEFISAGEKNVPFICSCLAILITFYLNFNVSNFLIIWNFNPVLYHTHQFIYQSWFVDAIQNNLSLSIFTLGHSLTYKLLDQGLLENLGVTGVYGNFNSQTVHFSQLQSGFLSHYIVVCLTLSLTILLHFYLDLNLENTLFIILLIFNLSFNNENNELSTNNL